MEAVRPPSNVAEMAKRTGYRPDVVGLACSRISAARRQSGLSIPEFSAALEPLLGWAPKPDLLRTWESSVAPPGHVVVASEIVAGSGADGDSVLPRRSD